ncbi:MAG: site-specific DNA-methyltransferase [Candidatus Accumulibacter sp.]|jgi:site-specific DNA-methyltransferase (adenine-specific)|nr:site-specific DNA-methyltransferase [Accumulibacter sp.]
MSRCKKFSTPELELISRGKSDLAQHSVKPAYAGDVTIECGDALSCYPKWVVPTCIISDGPYGLGKFPGEPKTSTSLAKWYAPHVAAWSAYARTDTTLWFWCTEIGWALVHPVLDIHGWQYEECNVWDKGIAHVAGNCNSKTIRGAPVVTEVAVRYTKRNQLPDSNGRMLSIKDWVRYEWQRSTLPMSKANDACGVTNAATRKYLTQDDLWYFPPPEAMVRMAQYCNAHGCPTKHPYFSLDGHTPITEEIWAQMRAKWNHAHGLTNVWQEPAVHGHERVRTNFGYFHANQKPLALMKHQILACTDIGDVVWEPFGGLCSASIAALYTGRRAFATEINADYFQVAALRLEQTFQEMKELQKHAA